MKRRDFIGHTTGLGMIVAAASLPGSLTGAAEFPDPCNVAALHTHLPIGSRHRRKKRSQSRLRYHKA